MHTGTIQRRPGAVWHYDGYRVVYPADSSEVRRAVFEETDVFVLDTEQFDGVVTPVRWVKTMTASAVVGVVGDAPAAAVSLADVALDRPLDRSAVETLTERLGDREAYLQALADYEQAVAADAGDHETARTEADERTAVLDASDRRAILDTIGG
jgi:hypothetical protein